MIITVQCPSCVTSFPVDTDKVPPAGVSARCSICASVFRVEKPDPNGDEPGVSMSDLSQGTSATEEAPEVADAAPATADSAADESWGETGAVETEDEGEAGVAGGAEVWSDPGDEEPTQVEAPVDDRPEATWSFEAEEEPSEVDAVPASEPLVESEPTEELEEDWRIEGFEVDLPELDSAETEEVPPDPDLYSFESPPEAVEVEEVEVEEVEVEEEAAEVEGVVVEAAEVEDVRVEAAEVTEPEEDTDAEEVSAPPPTFQFGKRDPHEKAQRLARVLVSDMIMYNPERHDRALAGGTLRDDFDDEIKKSWEEYIDQIGEEIAQGTSYFTDALNDILAKGERIFEGTPPS